jgi:hypothetical protein
MPQLNAAVVTKYRDRDIQTTCSPQRFRRLGKSVLLTEHVAYPLVCAQFRDGEGYSGGVGRYDRHVMGKTS